MKEKHRFKVKVVKSGIIVVLHVAKPPALTYTLDLKTIINEIVLKNLLVFLQLVFLLNLDYLNNFKILYFLFI